MAKKDRVDVAKLRILTCRDYPGLPGYILDIITGIFTRQKWGENIEKRKAETGMMQPQARSPQKLEEARNRLSPRVSGESVTLLTP